MLVRFALERLLYRLSISDHRQQFVLKGGMLVTASIDDDNRVTRDADAVKLTAQLGEIIGIWALVGPSCARLTV